MRKVTESYDEIFATKNDELLIEKITEQVKMKLRSKGMVKHSDFDDICQETLVAVYNQVSKYDATKAKASTFMYYLVESRLNDALNSTLSKTNLLHRTSVELINDIREDSEGNFEVCVIDKENNHSLRELVLDLYNSIDFNDKERRLLALKLHGYKAYEIAKLLGLSTAWVSKQWKIVVNKISNAKLVA